MTTGDPNGTAELISDSQTTEEQFLRRIFIRAQMSEFVRDPLLMARQLPC